MFTEYISAVKQMFLKFLKAEISHHICINMGSNGFLNIVLNPKLCVLSGD